MLEAPNDYRQSTRKEAIVWIAAACLTVTGRWLARQLAARRPTWAVLACASVVVAGLLAWRGQLVSNAYTFGLSRVEAASERSGDSGSLPADARYTSADVMATAAAVVALNAPPASAQDDPMAPLVPDAPMSEYAAPGGPDDGTPPSWLPDGLAAWWPDIVAAAHEHGLDSHAWGAIVAQECPTGDAACQSYAGASGLSQLMPATAADIEAQTGIDTSTPTGNLRGGAWYFAQRVRDNADLWTAGNDAPTLLAAAAAYNGGALPSQDVRQAAKAGAADLCAGVRYAETRVYCYAYADRWAQTLAERGAAAAPAVGVATPYPFVPRVAPGAPDHLAASAEAGR